jgi:hypothetical protein
VSEKLIMKNQAGNNNNFACAARRGSLCCSTLRAVTWRQQPLLPAFFTFKAHTKFPKMTAWPSAHASWHIILTRQHHSLASAAAWHEIEEASIMKKKMC